MSETKENNVKANGSVKNTFDQEFSVVIGYAPIKLELKRIVDIMNNPQKYSDLGVTTPRGVLINGDPGLGKTLIANCFIKASGRKAYTCRKDKPDGAFVDEIRRTYEEAKANAPSIVFLDDMDKFANEDEKHTNCEEYVTVQACIDSVKNYEVFTLATTNDIRKLPESLLRVGRFDKNFKLDNPKGDEAEKIIKYYLSKKKFVEDVNVKQIARILVGSSCAALETVINEAGVYAGFDNKEKIEMSDIIRATMRVLYEAPESLSIDERHHIKEIAYHEAGHAVVAEVLEPESVNIVSVKRYDGNIGGVTSYYPDEEYWWSKKYMENRVLSLLAGKSATELVYGVVDTGANNDVKRAFHIVERFVDDYCSYDFDNFEYHYRPSDAFQDRKGKKMASEISRYYQMTKKILADNREFLDKLANALTEKETMTTEEVQAIKKSCKIVNFNF